MRWLSNNIKKIKPMKLFYILALPLIVLSSCGQSVSSTLNEGVLLSNFLKKDTINSEIRLDSYLIIGNGFYIQNTSIYSSNDFDKLRNIKIDKEKEEFTTLYGGDMVVYSFEDETVRFWNNYLFIEGETAYKGVFYKAERSIIDSTKTKSFKSLHIDDGLLRCSDSSLTSDELRNFLSDIECKDYTGNESFSSPIKEVFLNDISSLKIYSEKVFSVFQSSLLYELNDGCDFSFLQS